MQRNAPRSVGDVLRELLDEVSLQSRMDELKAAEFWPVVAGNAIARLTSRPNVKNGVMCIGVTNASLRNELHMNRSRLCEIINQKMGKSVIKEIRFTT